MPTIPASSPNVQRDTGSPSTGAVPVAPASDGSRTALLRARRELQYITVVAQNLDISDIARDRFETSVALIGAVLDGEPPLVDNSREDCAVTSVGRDAAP